MLLTTTLVFGACQQNEETNEQVNEEITIEVEKNQEKIVSLNGAISEIICELGRGDEIVGVDVASTFPEWLTDSATVLGHANTLTVEGILNLQPTVVMTTVGSLKPEIESAIKNAGIELIAFNQEFSVEGTKSLVLEVAEFLNEGYKAQEINQNIDGVVSEIAAFDNPPSVLFIYARGAGTLMVAGKDTPMDQIVQLAKGENSITDFSDFKPLTEEALLGANPDVILMFDKGLQSLNGFEGLVNAVPAIAETNAGKNNGVIAMDGAFLTSFGPRLGNAAKELNALLTPYAK